MNQTPYHKVLSEARNMINEGLELTDKKMLAIADEAKGELHSRLHKVMERKGKRIRSILLYLLAGSSIDVNAPEHKDRLAAVAASIEMLHLASLLHDDVIDEQDLRRGQLTAHALWGNQMAVLVGDYALSKALCLVMDDPDRRVPTWVSASTAKLVEGEVLEIDLAEKIISLEQYIEVIDGKTAALIEAAAACASIISGHDPEVVAACASLGRDFGLAFQIIDDLLDYGIGAEDLGKGTYSDLGNGLMTIPIILYYQKCTQDQKNEMEALRQKGDQPEVQKIIFEELNKAGIFKESLKMALKHVELAVKTIEILPQNEFRDQLISVCRSMAGRNN